MARTNETDERTWLPVAAAVALHRATEGRRDVPPEVAVVRTAIQRQLSREWPVNSPMGDTGG